MHATVTQMGETCTEAPVAWDKEDKMQIKSLCP